MTILNHCYTVPISFKTAVSGITKKQVLPTPLRQRNYKRPAGGAWSGSISQVHVTSQLHVQLLSFCRKTKKNHSWCMVWKGGLCSPLFRFWATEAKTLWTAPLSHCLYVERDNSAIAYYLHQSLRDSLRFPNMSLILFSQIWVTFILGALFC